MKKMDQFLLLSVPPSLASISDKQCLTCNSSYSSQLPLYPTSPVRLNNFHEGHCRATFPLFYDYFFTTQDFIDCSLSLFLLLFQHFLSFLHAS